MYCQIEYNSIDPLSGMSVGIEDFQCLFRVRRIDFELYNSPYSFLAINHFRIRN